MKVAGGALSPDVETNEQPTEQPENRGVRTEDGGAELPDPAAGSQLTDPGQHNGAQPSSLPGIFDQNRNPSFVGAGGKRRVLGDPDNLIRAADDDRLATVVVNVRLVLQGPRPGPLNGREVAVVRHLG